MISIGQIPVYCGWVRRSADFSKIEPGKSVRKFNKTTGSMTWWASLIGNRLYFMPQPYQSRSEVEINLEEVSIVDPDDEKIAGKVALSTCLWICDEEGALVINADTLNEKQMWLRAFSPWISTSPGITSSGEKPKKVFLPASAAVDFMAKGLASIGLKSADPRNVGGRESPVAGLNLQSSDKRDQQLNGGAEKKGASNLFRSATKGVMKAFGVASSTSSTSTTKPMGSLIPQVTAKASSRSATPVATVAEEDEVDDAIVVQPSPFLEEAVRIQRDLRPEDKQFPATSLSELLPELDNLRVPLKKATRRVQAVKSSVGKALMSSTSLLSTAQEAIGKVAIGLAAVKVLNEEVLENLRI